MDLFFCGKEKCSCPADRCHMHRVLRFLLFIVDGEFAISAGHTGHTRHELAPGPRELPPSLHNPFASLPPEHPPSPVYLLCIDLVSQGFVPAPPPPPHCPCSFRLHFPVPTSSVALCASLGLLDSALTPPHCSAFTPQRLLTVLLAQRLRRGCSEPHNPLSTLARLTSWV